MKNKIKTIVFAFLIVGLIVVLTGCETKNNTPDNSETNITETGNSETNITEAGNSENDYVFKQLSFDTTKDPKENVDIAKDVLSVDRKNFRKKVTPSYMDEIQHNVFESDMFRYYLQYNEGEWPTVSSKDVSYMYYDFSDTKYDIEPYIEFSYKHTIEGKNVVDVDVDFIIQDIENTFGDLENEDGLRDFLEKEKKLIYDQKYEGTDTLVFKTASGVDVSVRSEYVQLGCGITIEASYKVEL
jgi:hypothetical protein